MVYLKEANYEDLEEEYRAIKSIPFYENGYGNTFCFMDRETFFDVGIRKMIDSGRGVGLKEGHVPESYFFLWDDNRIVGLFKIRHYLSEELRNGSGHLGFGIIKDFRNMHYGTEGLRLTLEKCRELVEEDEVYMACFKYNKPSLAVMLNNGARIVREDSEIYYTRVRIR